MSKQEQITPVITGIDNSYLKMAENIVISGFQGPV